MPVAASLSAPAAPAAVVPSQAMPEHERGRRRRREILEELARRWESFEPAPTEEELATSLGIGRISVRFHAARLREAGLLHPTALWITRAGYIEIRGSDALTK